MQILKLALRNLTRNRRRTSITLMGIAVSLGIVVWAANFQSGQYDQAVKSGISSMAGHVVIQAPMYQKERDDGMVVEDTDAMVKTLEQSFPDDVVLRRIFLQGIINSATNTSMAAVLATEPEKDKQVGELHEKLVEGEWLGDDDRGILLGQKMADSLGVSLGDKVVYMGQHGDNETFSRLFRVSGIVRTGLPQMDAAMAIVNLNAGQLLLQREGVSHQVTVHIQKTQEAQWATDKAKELVSSPEVVVLSWQEALPDLYGLMQVDKQTQDWMMLILVFIAAIGVLNTILMSVLERTREFGVLLAIGLKPRQLSGLVLLEGVLLGLLGMVLGVAFGLLLTYPSVKYGIDMTASMGEGVEVAGVAMSAKMKAVYDWERTAFNAVWMMILTILATAYPAWWLTKLKPVDAMRHH
jgi:ABC-type lipoprotein release transport system permease subunit